MNSKSILVAVTLMAIVTGCQLTPVTHRYYLKETLYQFEKNPARHAGRLVAFYGRVIRVSETRKGTVFQMLVKDNQDDFGGASLMVVTPLKNVTIAREHYVRVLGHIGTPITGQNAFGGEVTSMTMQAIAYWDLTARRQHWLRDHEDTFRSWESGELFGPARQPPAPKE